MSISVTPNGSIKLCKAPLERDYIHQLTFTSKSNQSTYFNGRVQKTYSNYTYIKKEGMIKVSDNIDAIINCNYLFYNNAGFTNKTYYCFITKMEYVNENCTAIYFETDVWQTWQFDITKNRCFVEREHVNNDTVGLHTVPEGLEYGDYVSTATPVHENLAISKASNILVGISDSAPLLRPDGWTDDSIYNGLPSGLTYIAIAPESIDQLAALFDNAGKPSAIVTMSLIPQIPEIYDNWGLAVQTTKVKRPGGEYEETFPVFFIPESSSAYTYSSVNVSRPSSLDGYTPKNNKLLCYPYNFLYTSNNVGGDTTYRWEDFSSSTATFTTKLTIGEGCSIKTYPTNYKNLTGSNAYNYGFTGQKMPITGWNSDAYTAYLAQNNANFAWQEQKVQLDTANSMFQTIADVMTGNLASPVKGLLNAGISAYERIGDINNQKTMASFTPDQAKGNIGAGDINYACSKCENTYYRMSIKEEYAKQIDGYLSMYGYKVGELKVPNLTGRQNWNFVKTVDCGFEGDIPQEDLGIIRGMFDKGVTLWHDPATMGDYSKSNNIV